MRYVPPCCSIFMVLVFAFWREVKIEDDERQHRQASAPLLWSWNFGGGAPQLSLDFAS